MIALVIIPLAWADPNSRKVLVPDESKPSERFLGEDVEGFYSVVQAANQWQANHLNHFWMREHCRSVAACDLPLYNVASHAGSGLVAIYVEHFSAPSDYDNHFVEAPLLSLPDVAEEYTECDEWEVGDWFIVTKYVPDTQDEKRGAGPFQAQSVGEDGVFTGDDVLYLYGQIRPCAAPEEEGEAEELSDETLNNIERKFFKLLAKDEPDHPWVTGYRSELPLPGSAGGSVTVPLRYDTHDRIVPLD